MVEGSSSLSGLGFSPLDYVAMWSDAARTSSASSSASARSTSASAASSTASSLFATSASQTSGSQLFAAVDDVTLQVELDIARLKAAAQQILRNRAAQMAAGGAYVSGGATYAYSIGPDGQLYATGVTLSYDTTPVANDPEATIQKMGRVRAAALASSSPTAADYAAASTAMQVEMQARLELVRQQADQYLAAQSSADSSSTGTLLAAFA